ncbi:uncharacterized protein LOC127254311 [Andrographis paniculata]|uniref:uncharacterized protein LOC127254311 n=1 Tax=Andrographis paniculata TaxID=175694 RepID=UPI0021E77C3C|nr:uncharacterized protein LOC127254311 [Andrographis paniculata]
MAALRYLHAHCVISPNPSCNRCSCSYLNRGIGNFIQCSASASPPPNRGFDPKPRKPVKRKIKKSSPSPSSTVSNQALGLDLATSGDRKFASSDDLEFEQRLQTIRRSVLEQKKTVVEENGAIDYDAPTETKDSSSGLGVKVGVGVAALAFGLVFAFGDLVPSESVNPTEEDAKLGNNISREERTNLEERLKEFEGTLSTAPEDTAALEGTAVTLAEMGEYKKAAQLLEKLTEKKQQDPDVFRLLGEVRYENKDYEGSVVAYRSAEKASESVNFEVLQGLTNSLLAAKKPDEAIQVLMASRERLNNEKSSSTSQMRSGVDPLQIDLLLGKTYSDCGRITDALAIYDQIISSHPVDFRGYLAKGIILKEIGSKGDAERMFIQARFFAPDNAKVLVDKYSG